jgi:uncharacterized Rmd1/YagE family protein
MTDSESDTTTARQRVLALIYSDEGAFSIREIEQATGVRSKDIIREVQMTEDVTYDNESRTVRVRRAGGASLAVDRGPLTAKPAQVAALWNSIDVPKKLKHRRPLGKAADIRVAEAGSDGRVGYVCVADEFLLDEFEKYYRDQGYQVKNDCDVLHIWNAERTSTGDVSKTSAAGLRGTPSGYGATSIPVRSQFDLFIFKYGAVVWWGFDQKLFKIVEQEFMHPSGKVTKFMVNRYKTQLINDSFPVWCTYSLCRKDTVEPDDEFKERLKFDHFLLPCSNTEDLTSASISMLCASHALAQSAKIDYLEMKITEVTQSCKPLPRELKDSGAVTITERHLLQLRGEVLSYRLMLKSGSDLLDEPELFWQNAYLKPIFHATKECFEINERVKALDTKLDADNEILSMIADQFHERHGARLEWIVIWLVLVEVIIGVLELLLDVKPWLR